MNYTDTPKRTGIYYYKLEDVDLSGAKTMHGPVRVKVRKWRGTTDDRR